MSEHELVNPASLCPAVGFSHVVCASGGRTLYFGGQTSLSSNNEVLGSTLAEQFELALSNLVTALVTAGGKPTDLVQLHIFVTDLEDYRRFRPELGRTWKRLIGRYYPAIALLEVSGLYEPKALVEITAIAVV